MHGHARDNAIASIGKIIKAHSVVQSDILKFWLSCLPLKFDKPEAHAQHKFLAELTISRPDLVSSNEDIVKTITVFAQILETKLISADSVPIVTQALKALAGNPYITANFASIA